MVSPARALSTAFWIVVKSQRPFLQTVNVWCGPLGLPWTLPGSCGFGYDWALAAAGASSAAVARAASGTTRLGIRMGLVLSSGREGARAILVRSYSFCK